MGWRDHLQKEDESLLYPWTGGRTVYAGQREFNIDGRLPVEHGWWKFKVGARQLSQPSKAEADSDCLKWRIRGFLVGDRIIPDGMRVDPDPAKIIEYSERIHLIDDGVERFSRAVAGRMFEGGPLIYATPDMPLGPEEEVLRAFQDKAPSVITIKGVTPALDIAFRLETWQRSEAEKRRAEIEKLRREEEERLAAGERRRQTAERLGDAQGRRTMALEDFATAAKAALAVGGAEYLDHRHQSMRRQEMVVTFRLNNRRFECICDARTLRIIDSGICLTDHNTNEKGDTRFTLESLPGVILQSIREGKLHVFRHVNNDDDDNNDNDDEYDY
ncbi:MAG TPA: hypothetical protein VIE65_15355 [Methylobacter sp.]|jgi:hypothetical protein